MSTKTMKKILICGCFRSGTTIVSEILNAHPQLLVTNEMETYLPNNNYRGKIQQIKKEFPYIGECIFERTLGNKFKDFVERVNPLADRYEILDLIQEISGQNHVYYGDKLPEYTLWLPRFVDELDNPKVIFCIRDPRDVIESQIRNYWRKFFVDKLSVEEIHQFHRWCKPLARQCIHPNYEHPRRNDTWLTYMNAWEEAKEVLKIDYYELNYDEMVKDTTRVAIDLASFLGINVDEMKKVFLDNFKPSRHQSWRVHIPEVTAMLPEKWKQMMARYSFEV